MQGITRRHDLLALKVGRPSRKGKLGELQNLPTKDHQNEIPLVKSFRSTRGMKWWSGSDDLVEENHHGRGLSGGAAAMVEEHGWWGRKKKKIGLKRPTNHLFKGPNFSVQFPIRPEIRPGIFGSNRDIDRTETGNLRKHARDDFAQVRFVLGPDSGLNRKFPVQTGNETGLKPEMVKNLPERVLTIFGLNSVPDPVWSENFRSKPRIGPEPIRI
jgi:hypothetical protein